MSGIFHDFLHLSKKCYPPGLLSSRVAITSHQYTITLYTSRHLQISWDVFANQNENFDSFATHSLLSLISGKFGGNWIVVGKFDCKFFWKPWKFGIETEGLNQIGFGRATADITSIWNSWRREGFILLIFFIAVFASNKVPSSVFWTIHLKRHQHVLTLFQPSSQVTLTTRGG